MKLEGGVSPFLFDTFFWYIAGLLLLAVSSRIFGFVN